MKARNFYSTLLALTLGFSFLAQIPSSSVASVPLNIHAIDAGGKTTCALRANNQVYCVGDNSTGQLGDGTTTSSSEPTPTSVIGAYSISVGTSSVCAIGSDKLGICWGDNSKGQLGNSSNGSLPRKIDLALTLSDLSVGSGYACAVTENAHLYCWGDLLVDGLDKYNKSVPTLITEITTPSVVSVGKSSVCVISGSLFCWGSVIGTATPTKIDGTDGATDVSVGDDFACAIVAATAKCFGNNSQGQLGQGNFLATSGLVTVNGISDAVKISAGAQFACVLSKLNNSYCWGNNSLKQISNTGVNMATRVPTSFIGVAAITTGDSFICALVAHGALTCQGDNSKGQSGFIEVSAKPLSPAVPSSLNVVSAGANTTCAVTATSDLTCWGQLQPSGLTDKKFVDVAVGNVSACAVATDGTVWCWGANGSGQLGNGSTRTFELATKVEGLGSSIATHVAAGFRHFCVTTSDGFVMCWGDNSKGQLGNSGADSNYAVPVSGIGTATSIASGDYHSCAMADTDRVVCWGDNSKKEILSTVSVKEPPTTLSFTKVAKVSAGGYNTCILTTEKKASCIGDNTELQAPVSITGDYLDVSVGYRSVCLIKDGTKQVSCLGSNSSLRLGRDGANSATPVDIAGLTAKTLSGGLTHNCVLTPGNVLSCWGGNLSGQLGSSFGFPSAFSSPTVTIGGKLNVGESITVQLSNLERDASVDYTWWRSTESSGTYTKHTGSVVSTVVIGSSDLSKFFKSFITLTKWGVSSNVYKSAAAGPVGPPLRLLLTPIPTISGKNKVGTFLSARNGRWDSGVKFTFQWYRGTSPIKGANKSTYKLAALDVGKQISVAVTGTKTGLPKVTVRSAKTAKVVR